jgi:hypothetical protein
VTPESAPSPMLLFVSVGAGGLLAIRRNRGRGQPALTG